MIQIINWLLILTYPLRTLFKTKFYGMTTFQSNGFAGWYPQLPWYDENTMQNWNDYNTAGIFAQKYGTFIFTTKLWYPITKKSWPAIWLLSIEDTHYLEIDIELMQGPKGKVKLYLGTYVRYGDKWQELSKHWQVHIPNRSLIRKLQTKENTFTIKWTKKRITWFINGTMIARTANVPHDEMFIILSKIDKCSVKVFKC